MFLPSQRQNYIAETAGRGDIENVASTYFDSGYPVGMARSFTAELGKAGW